MKRVSFDSPQSPSVDQEAKARSKYNGLLDDYLDVQKEFVSKKKKLQASKEKREVLSAEVGFLRQRLGYLTNTRSSNVDELKRDHVLVGQQSQIKLDVKNSNCVVDEAVSKNSSPVSDTNTITVGEKDGVKEKLVLEQPTGTAEKRTNIPGVIKRKS